MIGKPAFTALKQVFAIYTIAALLLSPTFSAFTYAEVDVCSNIEGEQTDVPAGFHLEGSNCIEDAPAPIDVCPNVDGEQTEVPTGFHVEGGNCVEDVPAPVDVCPNVSGDQTTEPCADTQCEAGTVWSIDNQQCTASTPTSQETPEEPEQTPLPPVDMCPNIDGMQATVPSEYVLFEGLCILETALNVAIDSVTAATSTDKGGLKTGGADGKGGDCRRYDKDEQCACNHHSRELAQLEQLRA